jgi:magnesium chelatase subunit D
MTCAPDAGEAPSRWQDAVTAATLFAVDPPGLGGIAVLAAPGPVRELWLESLRAALPKGAPVRRLPANIQDDRLLGGVDLAATLRAGRTIAQSGVLAEADGGIVVIPMAERLGAPVAAKIAAVLDQKAVRVEREGIAQTIPARIGAVAFDEGASPEERLPEALLDRFAFHIDLRQESARFLPETGDADTNAARALLAEVEPAPESILQALAATAAQLGIETITAPLLALRAARAAAALAGRREILAEDAAIAARLVLAPRARVIPAPPEGEAEAEADKGEAPPEPETNQDSADPPEQQDDSQTEAPDLADMILAAAQAAIPADLLAKLAARAGDRGPGSPKSGEGAPRASTLRGRPTGVRQGAKRQAARLSLIDTLRAAAPWQRLRQTNTPAGSPRIAVRREDFRVKTYVQRREATIVFCVDASGSTAFQRLAESKGAVELLLAEAYIARTHVALIVFRGKTAEILLPPTRSLSRAKALLADLPGGGGTPLAAGIDAAAVVAVSERAKGRQPMAVLLTDGRANVGRDGQASRPKAMADALEAAKQFAAQRIDAVFVDTSPRPREDAASIALAMGARYAALPYVEASAVAGVVRAAMPSAAAQAR